jgi:retinol dehydrogenase-12
MVSYRTQFFPPAAVFTETSLPDLRGKVYIVTGASAGVGRELARLLYSCNGTVYVAARSSERAHAAIQWAKDAHPSSSGALHFLRLELGDLSTIRPSVDEFLARETRLDVLFNNAGVMVPPQGSTTKQGFELQLGTNCVGPFLFTKLLTPMLARTARESAVAGEVRVVWVSSLSAPLDAPKGGVDMANLGYKVDKSKGFKYAVSKAGNILHAVEFQRRYKDSGIVSVVCFPSPPSSSCHLDKWLRERFSHTDRRAPAGSQPGKPRLRPPASSQQGRILRRRSHHAPACQRRLHGAVRGPVA